MSWSGHPIEFVKSLVYDGRDDLILQFSMYKYRPQSVMDERKIIKVPILDVNDDWLESMISCLPESWELAIDSLVINKRGRASHIPMIDFVGRQSSFFRDSRFYDIIGRKLAKSFVIFDSGRSFHAYSSELMARGDWVSYMGRLLLLNFPNESPLIDSRWVGHRLNSGYSSLRWSNNSNFYSRSPSRAHISMWQD